MKVGLFFGSFNPVHLGHLLVATLLREHVGLEEIWFVVSPLNPFKVNTDLADEQHRLQMVKLVVQNSSTLKVTDIEFHLSKPSYTHHTLKELVKQFPGNQFHLIIGEDNVAQFGEWKESEWIQNNFDIIVYNRTISKSSIQHTKGKFNLQQLPLVDISSTEIRNRIQKNLSIRYFVPENVEQYIQFHKLYQ